MKAKKRILTIALSIIAAALLAVLISAAVCAAFIKVTDYDGKLEGLDSDIKLVFISDLHGKEYGKDNKRLVEKIKKQNPDAILAVGDMINRDAEKTDLEELSSLLQKLLEIAPVYYSLGNHEIEYMNEHGEALLNIIAETGAEVLYDTYVETELSGNTLRIGGSCGHYRDINWSKALDYALEEEIGTTDIPALVMLHMPESLFKDSAANRWTGDIYICGHTHGGVIRIPGIGGLFAPTQGYFPECDRGRYSAYGHEFIISAGLSGYKGVPRIFNMPEICTVTLNSK